MRRRERIERPDAHLWRADGHRQQSPVAICVAGIAILSVLPSALARHAALLYGVYGLVIALSVTDLYLTFLVGDRAFLIGFQPPDGDVLNGTVAPPQ